ncbi:hypothetical protein GJR96_04350 [Haloferax sp. MBLA0076]|uniref:Uncharacterized protein n=1 Tax=Haloferax litoreum TaxID=2666140 RepID=A0A6A8GE66_9EURY|nr:MULTISPECIES: hypothetical protein [Haloferax]KAB1192712.1 hypothetical protein Hfx1148_04340 [Haloferax sp. CBA1148]MRX21189.1 hypothetical protein [Haloferax litoreum]
MTLVISIVVVVTLLGLSAVLYSSRVQNSEQYQATVVPLANIMDIGFVAMTPIIVFIIGLESPLIMFGLCALGYTMGWVMRYNIRKYEPIAGGKGALHNVARLGQASLLVASLVNVAYYLQLMGGVIVLLIAVPLGISLDPGVSQGSGIAVLSLVALGLIGLTRGLDQLNNLGEKTTAFNLAAITAIIVGFLAYNVDAVLAGSWALPNYNPPVGTEGLRKILGLFAIVQGFEASRYIGSQYSADLRIKTMRIAQIIATIAFVLFPLTALLLFADYRPDTADPISVVLIATVASPILPWLILLLAVGSQASAAVNAISSRSAVLLELTEGGVEQRFTYPILAIGAIAVVLVTDVLSAVAIASRVFAAFFTIQCVIALVMASRNNQWTRFVGIGLVGLAMLTIAIFGLPT